jgi:hypothetical protein
MVLVFPDWPLILPPVRTDRADDLGFSHGKPPWMRIEAFAGGHGYSVSIVTNHGQNAMQSISLYSKKAV